MFVVLAIFGTAIFCTKKYEMVCSESTTVVAIVKNEYRTTYVQLANGKVISLYTPTIKPGDTYCFKYKRVETDPKPYHFIGS